MPLLAKFIGTIATFFVEIFAKFLGYKAALALASFTAWLAVLSAFIAAVSVCLNALYATIQAGVSAAGSMPFCVELDNLKDTDAPIHQPAAMLVAAD